MGYTILLADDSVTVRRVVELAFQDTDIRVLSVGSGREALDRIETGRPDLVIADVLMPGPLGYDLCRAIKSSDRAVPVLLLRGAFEPFDERLAAACGADGTVTKPFEAQGLVRRVRDLLSRDPRGEESVPAVPDPPARDEAEEALEALVRAEPDAGSATPEAPPPEPVSATPSAAAGGREDVDGDRRPQGVVVEPREPGAATEVGVRVVRDRPESRDPAGTWSDEQIDALAERVVRRLSDRVVREIAWEVVPDLASAMIRRRLRELEGEEPESR